MTFRRALLFAIACGVGGIGAASCGGKPPPMATQIASWANGGSFSDDDASLEADFPAIEAGFAGTNLRALKTACDGLGIDASTIYGNLPSPQPSLTNELNDALTGLEGDATACNALTSLTSDRANSLERSIVSHAAEYGRARKVIIADLRK